MSNVVKLAFEQPMPIPQRLCSTCARRRGHGQFPWCEETTRYCSIERDMSYDRINRCGSTGKLWTPKQPGFFRRLGDAILARINP